MDEAARSYIRALENRNAYRRQPDHDIFELQNRVRDVSARLRASKEAVRAAVAARYGPTRSGVMRPASEGVYAINTNLAVRRGAGGPATAFWNVSANKSVYLVKRGRDWVIKYGPNAGKVVTLSEHWVPGGLRR